MVVQVTLTPNESKRLIAEAVATLPKLKQALKEHKVLFKGGTTVSALTEKLFGVSLRISGRISNRGAVTSFNMNPAIPHTLLVERGERKNVDKDVLSAVKSLGLGDIAIIGANAIDPYGYAAMMAGTEGGGSPGDAWTALSTEGAEVWILASWEKLIPNPISEAVQAAGRKKPIACIGMAVGLMPITGKIFTESEAFTILGKVKATVIGKGGVAGGEGSISYVLEGEEEEVGRLFTLVENLKGTGLSGAEESLAECTGPNPRCASHRACLYVKGNPFRRNI
ncbi:MAG: hypothetical protein SNJ78_01990 [Spirochaetales bacterium]